MLIITISVLKVTLPFNVNFYFEFEDWFSIYNICLKLRNTSENIYGIAKIWINFCPLAPIIQVGTINVNGIQSNPYLSSLANTSLYRIQSNALDKSV